MEAELPQVKIKFRICFET